MAIHALWEDRYALSVRKTAIDLSKTSADSSTATSHSNTGASNDTAGEQHFNSGQANVIGQVTNDTTGDMTFGLPVIGNPGISVGQDTIEVQKTDGFATMRVGGENEASDIFRAGQSPTASFEFVATGKSLISNAALVFQNGIKEVILGVDATAAPLKICKLPNATDGSEPQYYGTFIRKISSSDPNSHYLSDAIGTSISFRASQTEPLTVSTALNGRIMGSGMKLSGNAAEGGISSFNEGTVFGLDGKRNYLLQDSVMTFEDASGDDIVMACESFDITISSEVTPNRFNTFFPINMVLGNYTVEGSFTVPMLGKGGTGDLNYNYFMDLIADAGSSSGGGASFYSPKRFTVNWLTPVGAVDFTPGAALNFSDATLSAGMATNASSAALTPDSGTDYSTLGGQLAAMITLDDGTKAYVTGSTSDGLTITTQNESGTPTALTMNDAAALGNKATIVPWGLNDIMMRSNCIITDCTVGGSTEATMTVSFRALNQFTAGTDDILQDAFFLAYKDSFVTGAWGYASA